MARLWIRVIRHHRISQQLTVPCAWGDIHDALDEGLHELDIARPLWLNKHDNEMENFRRTAFLPEHFMEEIGFEKLEIEWLDDTDKKRKSRDPRNQF